MYRLISCCFIALALTSCSIIQKPIIEQGNIITPEQVSHLHTGMTDDQVRDVMGNPLMMNIFTPNRIEYIYTYQAGNEPRTVKRVSCTFVNGRLQTISDRG